MPIDAHLWAFLVPENPDSQLRRLDFAKIKHYYYFGRNPDYNDFVFPEAYISNTHCLLIWNGKEGPESSVALRDLSTNGTYVNGISPGKGNSVFLAEGDKVVLGQRGSEGYVYRQVSDVGSTLEAYYQTISLVGSGGFGKVYKVVSRTTGRIYACKIIGVKRLLRAFADRSDAKEVVMREVTILERIQHPNVCQVKEWFYNHAKLNVVLEWMDGGDLLHYILRLGALPEAEARRISYHVCDALSVQMSRIPYRDQPPVVKLADFGLAKYCSNSQSVLQSYCGTRPYMAPEVGLNNEVYNQIVDSWAVGATVFYMYDDSAYPGWLLRSPSFLSRLAGIRPQIILEEGRPRIIMWEPMLEKVANPEAYDFVDNLLSEDPRKRLSARGALAHPWLRFVSPQAPTN
ncbi:hypothetical protein NM688_g6374 [Phlebia brevispora]|uniref:Uncharacterized protein n=1 Tax=Phlebia brevispora TaxID=194682 RepID=A0ACC1SGP1_9APHY|nr:hypothetical protein NM688_g6374 [Phlebia brevispora]